MTELPPVPLGYATARPTLARRWADRVAAARLVWLLRRRPIGPAEVFVLAWGGLAVTWAAGSVWPTDWAEPVWAAAGVPYPARSSVARAIVLVPVGALACRLWVRRGRATAVGVAVVLCFGTCWQSDLHRTTPWTRAIAWALAGVAVAALVRLARARRWIAAAACVGFAVAAAALAGAVQVQRCPHATYLRVFSVLRPIAGRPCGNPQPDAPWWLQR